MGWFDKHSDAWNQANNAPHKAKLSHELIASAASYEAAQAYEKHRAAHGKPVSHGEAMKFLATAAGGYVDRLAETKGLDYVDREKAKRAATEHCNQAAY